MDKVKDSTDLTMTISLFIWTKIEQ